MQPVTRILGRTGLAAAATAAAMALYYLLGAINPSRAFAPLEVLPLLVAVFFVTTRLGAPYGPVPLLAPPILIIVFQGIDPDPTNTPFILTVILLVELLFLYIVSGILWKLVRCRLLQLGLSYVAAVLLTLGVLTYGLFPLLPLMSLPTILRNFLFGSVLYAIIAFLVFVAAGIPLLGIKAELLRGDAR